MADQIEEVKSKSDIVSVIGERINLIKAGRNYKALCPFHSEKTPSFMVSPELQMFKCFGCSESGDIFAFLEKYEGMDFYEALKYLAERTGVKLKPISSAITGDRERIYEINKLASRFYNYILLNHAVGKPALDYLLKDRGLKVDTIKTFNIGYSPEKPLALKAFLIDKKKISLDELEKSGIIYIKERRGFDRFRGRVIFPLSDQRGNVVGFAGRILPKDDNKDLAKYINTPETLVYHKSRNLFGLHITKADLKRKNEAIIVEGELDMISTWQAGIKNVVAIKGSALTEDQVRLLQRYSQRLILALDSDIAGDAAARRGIVIAQNLGMDVSVVNLGEFKDPDEAARNAPEKLKERLEKSINVWDFLIDSVFARLGGTSGSSKAKVSREIVPIISQIEDRILLAHYAGLIAEKLGVPVESVLEQVEENKKGKEINIEIYKDSVEDVKGGRRGLEESILAIILSFPNEDFINNDVVKIFSTPFVKKILDRFMSFYEEKKNIDEKAEIDIAGFVRDVPEELKEGLNNILLSENLIPANDLESARKYFDIFKKDLLVRDTKEKQEGVLKLIQKLEVEGRRDDLSNAEGEFRSLTELLRSLSKEK